MLMLIAEVDVNIFPPSWTRTKHNVYGAIPAFPFNRFHHHTTPFVYLPAHTVPPKHGSFAPQYNWCFATTLPYTRKRKLSRNIVTINFSAPLAICYRQL